MPDLRRSSKKMRSTHADYFNHDEEADGYDADVLNDSDPIRTNYESVLDWVVAVAGIEDSSRVLELGSGTGNLTKRIPQCKEVVCVDVSDRMEELSRDKNAHLNHRTFINDDVLAVFERDLGLFDAVLSTYTIHHLTEEEKSHFFQELWASLGDGGAAVFGDLMVKNARANNEKIKEYRRLGNEVVAEALSDEFFWHLEESLEQLQKLGFEVVWKRFSDISFGIAAYKNRLNKSVDTEIAKGVR